MVEPMRKWRQRRLMTQADLAQSARVSIRAIHKIEKREVHRCHPGTVVRLCTALRAEPAEIDEFVAMFGSDATITSATSAAPRVASASTDPVSVLINALAKLAPTMQPQSFSHPGALCQRAYAAHYGKPLNWDELPPEWPRGTRSFECLLTDHYASIELRLAERGVTLETMHSRAGTRYGVWPA